MYVLTDGVVLIQQRLKISYATKMRNLTVCVLDMVRE